MIAVDMGNTKTAVGLFSENELQKTWRLDTTPQTPRLLCALLQNEGVDLESNGPLLLASVVPSNAPQWETLRSRIELHNIDHTTPSQFAITLSEPYTLGADRIADGQAAVMLFGPPVLAINLGTATTFTLVNSKRELVGGAIAPGLTSSAQSLFSAAEQLDAVTLSVPKHVIGRNTTEAIQSGVVEGYASLVTGLATKILLELNEPGVKIVVTGGSLPTVDLLLPPEMIRRETLTLEGIYFLGRQFVTGSTHV